jgi:hypothetical protein
MPLVAIERIGGDYPGVLLAGKLLFQPENPRCTFQPLHVSAADPAGRPAKQIKVLQGPDLSQVLETVLGGDSIWLNTRR